MVVAHHGLARMIVIHPVGHTDLSAIRGVDGTPTWNRFTKRIEEQPSAPVIELVSPGRYRALPYWLGLRLQELEKHERAAFFAKDDGFRPCLRSLRVDALADWFERAGDPHSVTLVLVGTEAGDEPYSTTATETYLPILAERASGRFARILELTVEGNAASVGDMLASSRERLTAMLPAEDEVAVTRGSGAFGFSLGALLAAAALQARSGRAVGAMAIIEKAGAAQIEDVTETRSFTSLRQTMLRTVLRSLIGSLLEHRCYDVLADQFRGFPAEAMLCEAARHEERCDLVSLSARALGLRDVDPRLALIAAFAATPAARDQRTSAQRTLTETRHALMHWQPRPAVPLASDVDQAVWEDALGAAANDHAATAARAGLQMVRTGLRGGDVQVHAVFGPGLREPARQELLAMWRDIEDQLGRQPSRLTIYATRSPPHATEQQRRKDTVDMAGRVEEGLRALLAPAAVNVKVITASFGERDDILNALNAGVDDQSPAVVLDAGGMPVLRETLLSISLERHPGVMFARTMEGGGKELFRPGLLFAEDIAEVAVQRLCGFGEIGMLPSLLPEGHWVARTARAAAELAAGTLIDGPEALAALPSDPAADAVRDALHDALPHPTDPRWRQSLARAELLLGVVAAWTRHPSARSASRLALAARLALEGFRVAAIERGVDQRALEGAAAFFQTHRRPSDRCSPPSLLSSWEAERIDTTMAEQVGTCAAKAATSSGCRYGCPLAQSLAGCESALRVHRMDHWLGLRRDQLRPIHAPLHQDAGAAPVERLRAVGADLANDQRLHTLREALPNQSSVIDAFAALGREATLTDALLLVRVCYGFEDPPECARWSRLLRAVFDAALATAPSAQVAPGR